MKCRATRLMTAAWLWVLAVALASAAELPAPAYPTTAPERKSVTEEHTYYFTLRRYDPPVAVPFLKRPSERSYATPEAVLAAQLSAMFNGEFEEWMKGWSEASRRVMRERNRAGNRTAEQWVAAWKQGLEGKKAFLLHRIETGSYVLLEYALVPREANTVSDQDSRATLPFELEAGRWVATQDLASDPVLLNWKNPTVPVRRTIR